MDIQRIIEASKRVRAGMHSDGEKDRLCNAVDMMFCRDPLTLKRAVEVMGREPNQKSFDGQSIGWSNEDISVWQHTETQTGCHISGSETINPTVGQFACLVLAAKMGEQA